MTEARCPVVGGIVARYLRNWSRSRWTCASEGARELLLDDGAGSSLADPGGTATTTWACDPPAGAESLADALARDFAIAAGSRLTSWPPPAPGAADRTARTASPEPPVATIRPIPIRTSAASAPTAIRPCPATRRTTDRLRR